MKTLQSSWRLFFNPVIIGLFLVIDLPCYTAAQSPGNSTAKYQAEPPVNGELIRESRARQDLLDSRSPAELRVVQITTNPAVASHNIYTEIQVFTPDSRRFVFLRQRDFWLCDTEDGFSLRRLTDERGAQAPSVSPDGRWMYYFVNTTTTTGGALILKRVSLENFERQTVLKIDGPLLGTQYRPNGPTTLSSISSDGKRLCIASFIGDGETVNAPFGLLVYDLEKPSVKLIFKDQGFHNAHPQYCRSTDPVLSHDIMIQNNHGDSLLANGRSVRSVSGREGDLHIIRDDGTNWRDIPVGRDSVQFIQGHEQWRGRTGSVLSAMSIRRGERAGYRPVFLAWPVRTDIYSAHQGVNIPGGSYVDITRNLANPDLWHFSSDLSGKYLVSDTQTRVAGRERLDIRLVLGTMSEGDEPELKLQHLIVTGSSGRNPAHPHPFFSPDNRMIFFNSDVDGIVQIFMLTGYSFPQD